MTPNETTHSAAVDADEPNAAAWTTARHLAMLLGGGLLAVFAVGVAVGFATVAAQNGWSKPVKSAAVLGLAAALVALGAWLAWRGLKAMTGRQLILAPSTRRARSILFLSMLVGAAIGILLTIGGIDKGPIELTTGPIPPVVAAIVIAIWLIAMPWLSWIWWRNVDEVEAEAYKIGALWGIYAYAFIAPAWWIGWRGGFLPEPQEMITFGIVMLVWGIGWLRGKY